MDKKFIIAILAFAVLALGVGLLIPGGNTQQTQTLPWQIEHTQDGATSVFGLTLGQTTLQQAEQHLRSAAKIHVIDAADKSPVIEAYFDNITSAGLSAQMVMEIDVPGKQIQTMLERGERISTLASGARKVSLSDDDLALVRRSPIASITYLPRIRLQPDLIQKRFGEPVERIVEFGSNTEHWLYPDLGLDVALDDQGHAVLQYVVPARFSRLRQPLAQGGALQ
jgi:hypothetical protein